MIYKLRADVTGNPEFINISIPRYHKRGLPDQWLFSSNELATPRGLPIKLTVKIGIKDEIRVQSVDTALLVYYISTPRAAGFELWLPTDERLHVWLEEHSTEK